MAKTGLFGGSGQASPAQAAPASTGRLGGFLPEQGSRAQYELVNALLQSSMATANDANNPLLALLAPIASGFIGSKVENTYQAAQQERDQEALDKLLSTMGGGSSTRGTTRVSGASGASAYASPARAEKYNAMAATGGPTNAAASMSQDDATRELLAKTLMAEAGGEGPLGMLAAGAVIDNRRKSGNYGVGFDGVIMKPGQFSAWNGVTGYAGGDGGLDMANITPSEDAYKVADMILSGEYDDPTGGATHYYNPSVANPVWGQQAGGNWTRIGNHVFGFGDGAGAYNPNAASTVTSGNYFPFAGVGGSPAMSQDQVQTLVGLMTNNEISEPIRDIASSMLERSMSGGSMSPKDQVNLAREMLAFETDLRKAQQTGQGFRAATPEEAAAYGVEAGQVGPDGRFYPTKTTNSSGEAGVLRQQNEATSIIADAIQSLEAAGYTRQEALSEIAKDPIYASQFSILGIDPADLARQEVQEDAEEKSQSLLERIFGGGSTSDETNPENDPLGIR